MRSLAISLALLLVLTGASQERKPSRRNQVGDRVPEFAVVNLSGETLRLTDLQRKSKSGVVVLTFWCTICSSCRGMEARLEKLHDDYKDEAGVYAIDANSKRETPAQVNAFLKKKGFTFPVVMDTAGTVANLFGVSATTTTLLIDKDRILRYRGRFDDPDDPKGRASYSEDALKALLAGKPISLKQTPPVG